MEILRLFPNITNCSANQFPGGELSTPKKSVNIMTNEYEHTLKDISLKKLNSIDQLWMECKFKGPIIPNRSYHSAALFKEKYLLSFISLLRIYVFGGRDNEKGAFSELYCLSFKEKNVFTWS